MIKDEMNPIERMRAFTEGKAFDRIPFVLDLGETACHIIDTTLLEYNRSSLLMAEVEIATYRLFGQDGIGAGPGFKGLAEALGTKLKQPENNISSVEEPAVNDWNDLEYLEPANPKKAGRLPLFLEALKILKDKLGKKVPIGSCIGGPLSIAACLRGTGNLLRDLLKNPEKVHRLMQLATDTALLYFDEVYDLECGIDIAEPVASCTMISPAHFREFVKPYLVQYADHIRERTGSGPMLHICGDSTAIWHDMVETGAGVLSLDNIIDLGEAKRQIGNYVCLMGNVDPVNVIGRGTQEEIHDAVRHCLYQAGENPKGFILAPGCQIPFGTTIKSIQYYADAARTLGRYPLDRYKLNGKDS